MTELTWLALPGEIGRAAALAQAGEPVVSVDVHTFPDGESLVRVGSEEGRNGDIEGREVALVCGLDRPDAKLVPLLFAAATARELGARRVGLCAPYLAYMRQDRRFHPGEAVAARLFGDLLSGAVDWLVTVDPHLHRIHDLAEVYRIPTEVVHAAPALAAWIEANVAAPVIVGPDEESGQWVSAVAKAAGAPWTTLVKVRRGDRDVEVSVPDPSRWRDHTPVLADDIVSTGRTIAAAAGRLRALGLRPPVVVAVHALFAEGAVAAMEGAGVGRVVTTDAVLHPTNGIPLGDALGAAVRRIVARGARIGAR